MDEVEVVEHPPALVTPSLYPDNPAEFMAVATEQARVLAEVVERQEMYVTIGTGRSAKKHITVAGWTFLGAMSGVYPVTEWSRPVTIDRDGEVNHGWEARVIAVHGATGRTVGASEAMCLKSESRWRTADEYALRSMAETRARSKALRGPLEFVVQLAGFMTTPSEEMPADAPSIRPDQLAELQTWGERIANLEPEDRKDVLARVKAVTGGVRAERLTEDEAAGALRLLESMTVEWLAWESGTTPEDEEPF